ncbi:hypothetical protein [Lysinibacillus parviboronicapiens]|uniref:hypothetical protein n=1 Tax=Lysinibacillus parviboronicapiens TaxID=436516 RepID=UPI000D3A630D|nr:hypothetical protein [Lysinibacillus parviboronicapiens]
MMTAKVVNPFKEMQHNGHMYSAGDTYPAEGFEATEERVYCLTGVHPKYNKIYLAEVAIDEQEEQKEKGEQEQEEHVSEHPKHTGGGYYELSNGEKVKGKDEAIKAENALKSDE